MISLNCTSCQKVLEIDDAFAGGVCRCQYCGTIQTVPAKLKESAAPMPAKTLYQKKARVPGQPGTGLEDLADAVASSSGLTRGALRASNPNRSVKPAPPAPPPPPAPPKKNLLPVFVGISAALVVVIVVLIVILLRR